MRCDVIAEGVVAAASDLSIDKPLVVRLSGTNVDEGKRILAESDLAESSSILGFRVLLHELPPGLVHRTQDDGVPTLTMKLDPRRLRHARHPQTHLNPFATLGSSLGMPLGRLVPFDGDNEFWRIHPGCGDKRPPFPPWWSPNSYVPEFGKFPS